MANIDYNNYPIVLFTSFDKRDDVEGLPFILPTESTREYINSCKGLQELFGYIGAKNTLTGENNSVYYFLDDKLFEKVEYDDFFRERCFRNVFQTYIKAKYGVILFKDGGQYVFVLLGMEETKRLKNHKGRYIATALFQNNNFVGFEEGFITEQGLDIPPTGYYESGMDKGGFLSFALIVLGFAEDKTHPIYPTSMKEKIYQLK